MQVCVCKTYVEIVDAYLGRLVVDAAGRLAREQLGEQVVENGEQHRSAEQDEHQVTCVSSRLLDYRYFVKHIIYLIQFHISLIAWIFMKTEG